MARSKKQHATVKRKESSDASNNLPFFLSSLKEINTSTLLTEGNTPPVRGYQRATRRHLHDAQLLVPPGEVLLATEVLPREVPLATEAINARPSKCWKLPASWCPLAGPRPAPARWSAMMLSCGRLHDLTQPTPSQRSARRCAAPAVR